MDLSLILTSVAILGGVGLTFGTLIALANSKLKVWEDPRIDAVEEVLPGANCGACGLAGCRAFAEAAVKGEVAPAGCSVMGEEDREDVAEARRQWVATQLDIDPDRLVFIDETWAKTNMTRIYGRSHQCFWEQWRTASVSASLFPRFESDRARLQQAEETAT